MSDSTTRPAGPPRPGAAGPTDLLGWVPSAVVFDCDGLLVDTVPSWTAAQREVFARRGRPFGPQEKAQVSGRSLGDATAVMAALLGEPGAGPAVARELHDLMVDLLREGARPRPGAERLVDLVSRRVPTAVASNSPRTLLDLALRGAGLAGAFPVAVSAGDVAAPKPAPDVYLRACSLLGASADGGLALEDSAVGLRSAQAAGLRTVGVPSTAGSPLPADLVVASLADPELLAWVATWPRRARD